MKDIIKCKLFATSEEFEKWQEENNVNIFSILPFIKEIKLKTNEKKKNLNFETTNQVSIFITYKEVIE